MLYKLDRFIHEIVMEPAFGTVQKYLHLNLYQLAIVTLCCKLIAATALMCTIIAIDVPEDLALGAWKGILIVVHIGWVMLSLWDMFHYGLQFKDASEAFEDDGRVCTCCGHSIHFCPHLYVHMAVRCEHRQVDMVICVLAFIAIFLYAFNQHLFSILTVLVLSTGTSSLYNFIMGHLWEAQNMPPGDRERIFGSSPETASDAA
jgi:hypothetical protein